LRSGGRVDFVRTNSDPRLITGNIDLFGAPQAVSPDPQFQLDPIIYSVNRDQRDFVRDFILFNGFTTAEYLLTDTTTLFMNYGYAERAPTLTELYATGPFIGVLQQGTTRLIGDPNLSKERLNQLDVGMAYRNEWMQLRANAFYAWIQDYITFDANKLAGVPGDLTSAAGLGQLVFTNTDLATLAGTELFLAMNLTEWVTPFATLSYVQGIDRTLRDRRRGGQLASSRRNNPESREFAPETEPLPQIPPMEARAGVRLHEGRRDPRYQMEFEARMVAGQNNVARSLGEFTTPGFTIFNLRSFWRVNDAWILTAGVENIGDLLYREHLDPIASTILRARTGIPVAPLYRPGTNFFFTSQVTY
jgi:outer membrane receptor protein involved in Fe transport